MAQNQKLVALLVLCVVFATAMRFPTAEGSKDLQAFKDCYKACHGPCQAGGDGYTYCQFKCEAECSGKKAAHDSKSGKH